MSQHLSRAEILLAQSRPADAEREARLALGQDPGDALALTVLARALVEKARQALPPASAAVAAAPDAPWSHHVLAHVLHRLDQPKPALAAIERAIRLAPGEAELLGHRAAIRLSLRDWAGALSDSEAALSIQAEDTFAQNIRATALRQLGRAAEAADAGARILEQDPEDALSHSTQGWTLLHRGEFRRAQDHFREALRLRPDFESARQGMLEALKARNPLYRGMLAYFLWMGRQSRHLQWTFILVTFFGQPFVRKLAFSSPALGLVLWPLLILFYLFVYLTWTAVPMFNLLLRLDRYGRYVLSSDERRATNFYGASVLLILAAAGWWFRVRTGMARDAIVVAALLSVCVAATVTRGPRGRRILGIATAALAALAVSAYVLAFTSGSGGGLLALFVLGFVLFQFSANAIRD